MRIAYSNGVDNSGNPVDWRKWLQPASFRGIIFHVETGGVAGGRRVAQHEFPKRNVGFSEDMGRRIRRWPIQGYMIIGPFNLDYTQARNSLIVALEQDGPGTLVHPTLGQQQVMVDTFSYTETREKGGYCQFEMVFVEAGSPVVYSTGQSAALQASSQTDIMNGVTAGFVDGNMTGAGTIVWTPGPLFSQ
jgi:prophage DNA circulation protein